MSANGSCIAAALDSNAWTRWAATNAKRFLARRMRTHQLLSHHVCVRRATKTIRAPEDVKVSGRFLPLFTSFSSKYCKISNFKFQKQKKISIQTSKESILKQSLFYWIEFLNQASKNVSDLSLKCHIGGKKRRWKNPFRSDASSKSIL